MKSNWQRGNAILFSVVLTGCMAAAQSAPAAPAASDQSSPSLGDYARRHKDSAKTKAKVFDNDNLPKDDKLSVVGDQTAANEAATAEASAAAAGDNKASADAKASGAAAAPAAPAPTPEEERAKKQAEWKTWQDKIASQRNANDLAARELDVLQKEYQLRAAAMYADVGNRLRNSTQWDKEEADFKQKIADKQKAVDDGKQKLDDMEEGARKAGVPAAMREAS